MIGTENHAPLGSAKLITLLEDGSYTFKVNDFGFVDPTDIPANSFLAVEISTLPLKGTLSDNGVAVTSGQFISVTDISNHLLVYTPATDGNGTGYGNFTFQVQDDGGTTGGGIDTDPVPKTMSIDVTSVNNAPVGTSGTVTVLENTAYTFKTGDFGFADPHDNPPNILLAVKIATVPATCVLKDNGVTVNAGQFVSAADILGGKLVFTADRQSGGSHLCQLHIPGAGRRGHRHGGLNTGPDPEDDDHQCCRGERGSGRDLGNRVIVPRHRVHVQNIRFRIQRSEQQSTELAAGRQIRHASECGDADR